MLIASEPSQEELIMALTPKLTLQVVLVVALSAALAFALGSYMAQMSL
jgi:hypothetical protein